MTIPVGRAVATVQLLRFISDPPLRRRVTAATDKVESFNNFTDWPAFCNGGVIAENDPAQQEEAVKLTSLLTNCVIFDTTLPDEHRAGASGGGVADHRGGSGRH
ncbi:Tn3 family transposase [Streptomyces sp. NBC_00690]|uniref:Tn3 family transposase n=1 Tax=Streptomyces sp. NBC_00690 TaxID=2975808 RepID=UPI002E2CEF92|nr:Tn3 family transposase [Streptomyces sp. NBC_00690]